VDPCHSQDFDLIPFDVAYWSVMTPIKTSLPMERNSSKDHNRGQSHACPEAIERVPIVNLEAEVPEVLFRGMRDFLKSHPEWDQYSVITSSLASFLFQNGCCHHSVTKHYLDTLFLRS
jgi:hypothetical protein